MSGYIPVILIGLNIVCMGSKDFFELIEAKILDSALTDTGMMKAQIFVFQKLDKRAHSVLVFLRGSFLSFEFLLFSLDVFLLGGFGLFSRHYR